MRLVTSLGMINLELRSDLVPKTVHNFLLLCHRGYYNGTKFHRLIKGFMMQVPASSWAVCAMRLTRTLRVATPPPLAVAGKVLGAQRSRTKCTRCSSTTSAA